MKSHAAIRRLLGFGMAFLLALPGAHAQDWPMFGGNVQSTSANPRAAGITSANVKRLRLRRVKLSGVVDASAIFLRNAVIDGARRKAIFVTTSYGRTLAVNPDNGSVLWEYTPASYGDLVGTHQFTNSTPVADPDGKFIYAASPDGYIQKLAVSNGRVIWRTRITQLPQREKMDSPLKFFAGHVIAVTAGYIGDRPPYQGHVAILDGRSGALLHVWNSLCSNRAGLIPPDSCRQSRSAIWGRAGAVIDPHDGHIFIATGNGRWNGSSDWGDALIELNSTATRILGNYTPVNTEELDDDDLDLGSTSPVLLGSGLIAQGGKDGKIRLLGEREIAGETPHQGHELQIVATPGGTALFSQPAVWRDGHATWMFVSDSDGTAAWRTQNGHLHREWTNDTGGTSPFEADGLLFVYAPSGGLNVYAATSGERMTRLPCGRGHWNSPIVVDGMIVLPEGNANSRASTGVLDIWSVTRR
jgi:outer membrane protein assembly factor BamB